MIMDKKEKNFATYKEFCHIQRIWKDASGSGKHILQTG